MRTLISDQNARVPSDLDAGGLFEQGRSSSCCFKLSSAVSSLASLLHISILAERECWAQGVHANKNLGAALQYPMLPPLVATNQCTFAQWKRPSMGGLQPCVAAELGVAAKPNARH